MNKIVGTAEAWEAGLLGQDEEFAKVSSSIDDEAIDASLQLKMISIRLQKGLINDLKSIAELQQVKYQSLIKRVLSDYVDKVLLGETHTTQ